MSAGSARHRVEAMLADYYQLIGLASRVGLTRVLRELVEGIVWSCSVQLTNAA